MTGRMLTASPAPVLAQSEQVPGAGNRAGLLPRRRRGASPACRPRTTTVRGSCAPFRGIRGRGGRIRTGLACQTWGGRSSWFQACTTWRPGGHGVPGVTGGRFRLRRIPVRSSPSCAAEATICPSRVKKVPATRTPSRHGPRGCPANRGATRPRGRGGGTRASGPATPPSRRCRAPCGRAAAAPWRGGRSRKRRRGRPGGTRGCWGARPATGSRCSGGEDGGRGPGR